ncbi:hypothetical protein HYPDE_39358 [Hyphomicrobium denitrificans 1NES1]|uniref:Uncharacterized protein n=1 Tax=Hyphomicrobium denitrificans 1NES1 TaxID=670307 RepID=N0BHD6_9HYPH|nr:hypothetical protein HYPDE_39358 [Hyphomicrobium denitrificans 1NES1]
MSVRHTTSEVNRELDDLAALDLDALRRRWAQIKRPTCAGASPAPSSVSARRLPYPSGNVR